MEKLPEHAQDVSVNSDSQERKQLVRILTCFALVFLGFELFGFHSFCT
jgi:hypothetical protein